jgi:hypothetical protein
VSKGFLVIAQNNKETDYVSQAYALALSIKATQIEHTAISLITNNKVPKKYKAVFDNIIPIPWEDDAATSKWKVENRWKFYHVTPYDETIILDTDMLILDDLSVWWKYCEMYNIKFCSRITNYKLETVTDKVHRKAFVSNKLPNVYFALHYFKKSDTAYEFYKVLEFVVNNWEWCYSKFAPEDYQNWLSMDLAAAIAIELLGIHQEAYDTVSPLEFTHMKSPLQGWTKLSSSWQDNIPCVFNSRGELLLGNIKQDKVFHYVEKNFITPQILKILENRANG